MQAAKVVAKSDVAPVGGRGFQLGYQVMWTSSLAVVLQAALCLCVALVVVLRLAQAK